MFVPLTLIMGYAMRMCHMTGLLSSVAYLAVLYFCTLSHKWKDFLKKNVRPTEQIIRVLNFSTIFVGKISDSRRKCAGCDNIRA